MKTGILAAAALAAALLTSGCYLLQQGTTLVRHQIQARATERLLADDDISHDTREFFQLVEEILAFSRDEFDLADTKNYTTYVELDRNYLAAVVSAAEELSFTQHIWSFPIVGDVPYKGFYNPEDARREAKNLKEQGYDTWISPVTAFSTLGYFRDPLYSFMKGYSTYRLADLIIHEQTHATIWVRDQARFNEEIATFIGNRGAELFVKKRYGEDSPQYREIFDRRADRRQFIEDMNRLKRQLEQLYAGPLDDEAKRREKQLIITEFQEDFAGSYEQRYLTGQYAGIAEIGLNNAYISISSYYHSEDDIYDRFYAFAGEDPAVMIDLLKPLDGSREDPYAFMETLMKEEPHL